MQIIDNHIIESKAASFLTDFPGEYYTFLKGKWKVYPKENRGRLRAGRRNERHERRGKLRMLLYERIKCWEMTRGRMKKTGMVLINQPAVRGAVQCHICGAACEGWECRDCEEYTCSNCIVSYTQFNQIDYTMCTRCESVAQDNASKSYYDQ